MVNVVLIFPCCRDNKPYTFLSPPLWLCPWKFLAQFYIIKLMYDTIKMVFSRRVISYLDLTSLLIQNFAILGLRGSNPILSCANNINISHAWHTYRINWRIYLKKKRHRASFTISQHSRRLCSNPNNCEKNVKAMCRL